MLFLVTIKFKKKYVYYIFPKMVLNSRICGIIIERRTYPELFQNVIKKNMLTICVDNLEQNNYTCASLFLDIFNRSYYRFIHYAFACSTSNLVTQSVMQSLPVCIVPYRFFTLTLVSGNRPLCPVLYYDIHYLSMEHALNANGKVLLVIEAALESQFSIWVSGNGQRFVWCIVASKGQCYTKVKVNNMCFQDHYEAVSCLVKKK